MQKFVNNFLADYYFFSLDTKFRCCFYFGFTVFLYFIFGKMPDGELTDITIT